MAARMARSARLVALVRSSRLATALVLAAPRSPRAWRQASGTGRLVRDLVPRRRVHRVHRHPTGVGTNALKFQREALGLGSLTLGTNTVTVTKPRGSGVLVTVFLNAV